MKLIDTFMAFLIVVGAFQFFYCVLVGNFVWQTIAGSSVQAANYVTIAIQCLPLGFQYYGGTICPNGEFEDADKPREQERVQVQR